MLRLISALRARGFARVIPLAALFAALALAPGTADAANRHTTRPAGLSPTANYLYLAPNRPSWCLAEDDQHSRTWSGSLNGSFTASEQLCDPTVDYFSGIWWDPGGVGLQADLYVVGALSSLTITSPVGDSHQAVLIGSTTSKGVITNHYQVCYVPPFSPSSDTGGTPLPGGTWQVAFSGSFSSATYSVNAEMAYVEWQQSSCPASEQNLVS